MRRYFITHHNKEKQKGLLITPSSREAKRQEIIEQTDIFLWSGGTVKNVASTVSKYSEQNKI